MNYTVISCILTAAMFSMRPKYSPFEGVIKNYSVRRGSDLNFANTDNGSAHNNLIIFNPDSMLQLSDRYTCIPSEPL